MKRLIQNPATERKDLLKIQQETERTYSKSSNRERGLTQNPATERKDLFKIQQQRERTYSKSSKRESDGVVKEGEREKSGGGGEIDLLMISM